MSDAAVPEAAAPDATGMAAPTVDSGKKGRKEKAPKAPKVKAAKPMKTSRNMTERGIPLFSMSDQIPDRKAQEQEAAAELMAAMGPSMQLLRHEVPDAGSPDDAYRSIEGKLGPAVRDPEPTLPEHRQYTGDALVYYQLRRHYGRPHPGSSSMRSWYPGGQQ